MKSINLTDSQRRFFSLVSKAAFLNPFSKQRFELDLEIIGDKRQRPWRLVVPEVIKEVNSQMMAIDKVGIAKIADFPADNQPMMRNLFLFYIFHRFMDVFDKFIVRQSQNPAANLEVDFADDVIGALISRGFSREFAVRCFSMFYQIRRGFYFIDRGLIGSSDAMRKLRCDLWNNIFTHDIEFYNEFLWDKMEDFSTLLLGPTGSGKGAAAAAIGRSGFIPYDMNRRQFKENFMDAFVPINLSQYAETLLESELFGHTKGSFTGAVATHEGLFAMCSRHGSVFLDEIGDVSEQVQTKLLRVLQERSFSPVGSHKSVKFEGRVIAATNKSIDELRREGDFRDDFYYRLCSDTIIMPSLAQRVSEDGSELTDMITHLVRRIAGDDSKRLCDIVKEVIDKNLGADYYWPGNVRELEQCVRRVIIKRDYSPQALQMQKNGDVFAQNLPVLELLSQYCTYLYNIHKNFEKVARITNLDRRTVKKYVEMG
ncbi:MAG: sigma 54-interacting transcriptional regulator [Sedimentisphaeraceae bacterium JB056]